MTVLAIDQGTTSTRAVAVAEDGSAQVLTTVSHRQIYPRQGWVEHDPEELITNLETCLQAGASAAQAVGIDNQGESCLGWDARSLKPVTPVIVWQDERTRAETERLRAEGAEELTLSRAGLPLDPYFSASKLGWILKNVSEAQFLAKAGRLCLGTTDAFFRHRLTGHFETDVTTASRTSLMNLSDCAWDEDLCRLFGVPVETLPAISATMGHLGEIHGTGRLLTASVVDQQAALRGHGCKAKGDAKITFGTGAFVLAVAGQQPPGAGSGPLPTVAWAREGEAPTFALDGGVYTAAAAVNWAKELGLFSDWSEINGFATAPAISRGIAFVPALAGLACPHWDRRAKGTWMGLGLDTARLDLVQAVLEGVAFRTAEVVAAMEQIAQVGAPVSIDGGMTRNPWFCQFLADTLGREVFVSAEPELTALGTAILAAEGAGLNIASHRSGKLIAPAEQPVDWRYRFAEARQMAQDYGRRS